MSTEHDDHESRTDSAAGGEPPRREPGRPRRRLAVTAAVAAVLLAAGGGAYWAASADGGGHDDKVSAPTRFDGPAPVGGDTGTGGTAGGGGHYRLTGTLPKGPATAAAYRPAGGTDKAAVQRLAALLGVSGPVESSAGSWRVGGTPDGGGPALLVGKDAPGTWSYSRLGAPATTVRPLGGPGSSGSSSAESSGSSASTAAPPVSVQKAEAAVRPVLGGLGLSGAHLDAAATVGALRTVTADPVVGGLPTSGWSTSFEVGSDGRISLGYGRLSALEQAATSRVMTAAQALKQLDAPGLMHPDTAVCPGGPVRGPVKDTAKGAAGGTVKDDGADSATSAPGSCPPQAPSGGVFEVRGAQFGLALQFVSGEQELTPAWLFRTAPAGSSHTDTVAEPAVVGKDADGSSGTLPQKTPTAPPSSVAPVDPGGPVQGDPGQPVDPRAPHAVPLTAYQAAGAKLTVVFWGGVCATYQVSADESATQVRVRVTQTPARAGKMCPMIEKSLSRQVALKQPLGGRDVVDTSNGRPVRGR